MQALGEPVGELEGDRVPDGLTDAEVQRQVFDTASLFEEAVGVGGVSHCDFRLTAFCVGFRRVSATPDRLGASGPWKPADATMGAFVAKNVNGAAIAVRRASQAAPKLGCRVAPAEGRLAMETLSLDRLSDEIAELSAHLDAATARLLDLIRAFDAREGWNTGFRSCAAWLSWRVGLDLGAARERVRVARALGTLPLLAQALA